MSEFLPHRADGLRSLPPVWTDAVAAPDAEVTRACSAARAAVRAFDEAARGGATFGDLCELSVVEQRAVKAVSAVKSATPKGIAEKAQLLDCYLNTAGRRDVTEETFDVVVSLAADALALAKAMMQRAPQRSGLAAE